MHHPIVINSRHPTRAARGLVDAIRADLLAIASDVDYWSRQTAPLPTYVLADLGARASRLAANIAELLEAYPGL